MKNFLIVVSLCLLILISFPQKVFASCTPRSLPNSIKQIIANNIPIPVLSPDIQDAVNNTNLIIQYKVDTEYGIVTGQKINFADLKGAKGYLSLRFQLKEDYGNIPVIKNYMDSHFSSYASLFNIRNVEASYEIIDQKDKVSYSSTFPLRTNNNIDLCFDYNQLKDGIKEIKIKINSFKIDYTRTVRF
ncbi:hypothetical protein ACN4EE_14670 [Geminocystis sp. CENA526]|uniref:hypothetical protein n=1 Tax=Geminocystis sp. CENA526 TaxID=1355871 RepID=UPI003D70211D